MWPNFSSMLSTWQWAALLAVPPAIVALYFLKLKRQPLVVPSTYLWRKSIEDLHVNSLWQRLRQSLLLFLQLALLMMLIVALLRPSWQGAKLSGGRYIFLVDNSASMGATDVEPSRLDEAKRRVAELIDEMDTGDVAMLISFADSARVEQSFTDNRSRLRQQLAQIKPSHRPTSLAEALRVASGLANPGRSATDVRDFQVAEALPAKLFIFSDGGFADVSDFSLGNLDPVFVPVGRPEAANVAIATFSTGNHPQHHQRLQAFARLENHGPQRASVGLSLKLDDALIDADRLELDADESGGVAFDLGDLASGVLVLEALVQDDLQLDNRAWVAVEIARRTKVLLVTPGNEPVENALRTPRALELAEVTVENPSFLAGGQYPQQADDGAYDLVIYDRCQPEQLPHCSTLFIGRLPPGGLWKAGRKVDAPQIIDTDRAHPLMQMIDMGDVLIAEGVVLEPPAGGTVLIDSNHGALFAIAPRLGFEDAVLGFEFIAEEHLGTDWPVRVSFPVFVLNVLHYFGQSGRDMAEVGVRPGEAVSMRLDGDPDRVGVTPPLGRRVEVSRGKRNRYLFSGTSQVGVYRVDHGGETLKRFAVNLFDRQESRLAPRAEESIKIGYVTVKGQAQWQPARRDGWKVLLLLALAVLLFEWYIYNRRVYI